MAAPNGSSDVQITIRVVDQNSGQVINQVVKNLESLGNAGATGGNKLADGLKEAGTAGTTAGQTITEGLGAAGAATAETTAEVRSLSLVIGELAGTAIGMGAALVAAFAVSQVVKLIDDVKNLDAASQAYEKTLQRIREQDYTQPRDTETARLRFQQSASAAQQRSAQIRDIQERDAWDWNPVHNFKNVFQEKTLNDEQAKFDQQRDKLGTSNIDETHKQRLEQIELNHAMDSTFAGQQKINAALQRQREINAENRRYTVETERYPGNIVAPNAGASEQQRRDQIAQQEAAAQTIQLNRDSNLAIMQSNDARVQASLTGEALYYQKMQDDIREMTVQLTNAGRAAEIPARVREINTRFIEDSSERWVKVQNDAALAIQHSSATGLTGQARLDAQHGYQINQINSNRQLAENPDLASQERKASNDAYLQQSEQLQQQFNDRIAQMDSGRTNRYMSENDKIAAATQRTVDTITKAWDQAYGQLDPLDQRRVQSYTALQGEIVRIQQDADRQRRESSQRLEDETERMEREANRTGLPREQEQTQAIVDEYQERYQRLEELRAKDSDNADKYRRQEAAAQQIMNGKLVDQQRALADRLTSTFQGFFDNPLRALQREGERIIARTAANFFARAVGPGATGSSSGIGGGLFRGTFSSGLRLGNLFGGSGTAHPSAAASAGIIAQSNTTLQAATATIHVDSAIITGIGGTGASPMASSGTLAIPGLSQSVSQLTNSLGSSAGSVGSSTTGSVGTNGASSPSSTIQAYQQSQAAPGSSVVTDALQQVPKMTQSVSDLGKSLGVGSSTLSKVPGVKAVGGALNSKTGQQLLGVAGDSLGVFSAVMGKGGVGGAFQGALSGAKLGAQIGGPIGAAIGAIGGGIVGLFGFGARAKAAQYDKTQVRPQMQNELQSYEAGATDYQTAYNDLDSLSREAKIQTRQFGSGGEGYWNDTIAPEIKQAQDRLTREEKAGRSQFGFSAAQFHSGGVISDFGSLATSPTEGYVHAKMGEVVLNEQAAMSHSDVAMMMNAGATRSDVASYLGGGTTTKQALSSPADVNLHFHSMDAKGARQLLMDNKHVLRAAVNASYDENSGGFDGV